MRRFACALQLAANDVLQRELLLAKQRGAQLEAKLEAKEETHELARRYATDRAREQEAALRAAEAEHARELDALRAAVRDGEMAAAHAAAGFARKMEELREQCRGQAEIKFNELRQQLADAHAQLQAELAESRTQTERARKAEADVRIAVESTRKAEADARLQGERDAAQQQALLRTIEARSEALGKAEGKLAAFDASKSLEWDELRRRADRVAELEHQLAAAQARLSDARNDADAAKLRLGEATAAGFRAEQLAQEARAGQVGLSAHSASCSACGLRGGAAAVGRTASDGWLQAKVREQAKALEAALTERERELAKAERTAAEAVGRADALIVERRELRQRMAKERSA